jgi:hypothetical protein
VPIAGEIELPTERMSPNWTRAAHGRTHAVILRIKRSPRRLGDGDDGTPGRGVVTTLEERERSLDHLISQRQQLGRNFASECLCDFEVDH